MEVYSKLDQIPCGIASNKTIDGCIVLEGGAFRGLYTAGVLDALMENAEIKPVVNQIFLNPSDLQPEVVAENKKYDMLNEAYSPLGTGGLLGNDVVKEVAVNYGKSPAQVLIRWSLQHGFLPLPKSVHPEYIKANAEVFDFEISPEDMVKLDGLHGVAGLANDPDKVNF